MNKEKIIIYVFGPKRVYDKYMSGQVLEKDNGEWLKIGLTRCSSKEDDAYECALTRCKGESKTGIPETSYIFDVFQFPNFTARKVDDDIRRILQVYNIESSMQNNKCINDDEIPAGQEFVYGLNRTQVLYAISAYRGKILLELDDEQRAEMLSYIDDISNDEDNADTDDNSQNDNKTVYIDGIPEKYAKYGKRNKDLWQTIYNSLSDDAKKEFNLRTCDYRSYHNWHLTFRNIIYNICAGYSKKAKTFRLVIWGNSTYTDNNSFYNFINNNKLFSNLYSWREKVKRSGDIDKEMLFFETVYQNAPNEKTNELSDAINNLYKYIKEN